MGACISSPREVNIEKKSFPIYMRDDIQCIKCIGTIDVSVNIIALYQKDAESLQLPFKCITSYTCEEEVFSFAFGDSRTTGLKVYSFRCERAGELFSEVEKRMNIDQRTRRRPIVVRFNTSVGKRLSEDRFN